MVSINKAFRLKLSYKGKISTKKRISCSGLLQGKGSEKEKLESSVDNQKASQSNSYHSKSPKAAPVLSGQAATPSVEAFLPAASPKNWPRVSNLSFSSFSLICLCKWSISTGFEHYLPQRKRSQKSVIIQISPIHIKRKTYSQP